jgi:hypothetical protein
MTDKIILKGPQNLLKPLITHIIAVHQLLEQKDIGTVYAVSPASPPVVRRGRPKVQLFFLEDTDFKPTGKRSTTPHGRRRAKGEISFRLMNETTQSITKGNGAVIGRRIKELFGSNSGFVWSKGKVMYSYTDWDRGYQFQLLCRTKTEAKRIVQEVLKIQSHTPDWEYFNTIETDDEAGKYPENPGNQTIMGETVPVEHARPNVDVRFQYAVMHVQGLARPVPLYDRSHKLIAPLAV